MSFPCQCPPKIGDPFPYKPYTCQPDTLFLNYFMSLLLLRSNYYNYIQTGVNQAPTLKNKYSYKVPIYLFKYYSLLDPKIVLKTYTYEQVFNIYLIAQQYKTLAQVPPDVKNNWDKVDIEFYTNILLLPTVEALYQAVAMANQQRALGLSYSYTFTLPANIVQIFKDEIPANQSTSKCYPGDELIVISRNAQPIVNAYVFKGLFPGFTPDWN